MHYLVRADVLGNTARFAASHIRVAHSVQQGGLAVVNMS